MFEKRQVLVSRDVSLLVDLLSVLDEEAFMRIGVRIFLTFFHEITSYDSAVRRQVLDNVTLHLVFNKFL